MENSNTLSAGKFGAATALGFGLFWIAGSIIAMINHTGFIGMDAMQMHRGASEMMGDGPVFIGGFAMTILAAILVWLVVTIYNKIG